MRLPLTAKGTLLEFYSLFAYARTSGARIGSPFVKRLGCQSCLVFAMAKRLDVDALLSGLDGRRFESRPFRIGDGLSYFTEDVRYFADFIDPHLTLYRASDDRRVIGAKITPCSTTSPDPHP